MEGKLVTDTSDFMSIETGDTIEAGGSRYIVTGHERERRFGIDDPKFWVKRAVDGETGEKKIIKLSFFESFETNLGGVAIHCFRSPQKEGEILAFVKDHPHFMQGEMYTDSKENNIRILKPVPGPNLFNYIYSFNMSHETYFHSILPGILKNLTKALEAIRFLHINGFKHGDIRSDHIIIDSDTGNYVWIDFDYDYKSAENPFSLDIFELGNILLYTVGKGFHNLHMIQNDTLAYGDLKDRIEQEDFSILHKWRFLNLQKLYPHIPAAINDILKHFSRGAEIFYESVEEIIEDLNRYVFSVI